MSFAFHHSMKLELPGFADALPGPKKAFETSYARLPYTAYLSFTGR